MSSNSVLGLDRFLKKMAQSSDEEFYEDEIINVRVYQVQPFMFEPGGDNVSRESKGGSSDASAEDSNEEEESDINLERIGNTDW